MKEHEIVAAVRKTAGIDDPEQAASATRATLAVLGRRLAGGEAGDLSAQLPSGIDEALPAVGGGETFGVEEFYRRVAESEDCTQDAARQYARAVVAALKAGVTRGEFEDLKAQLPADYREDLLTTAPSSEQHRT
jgi:uncharacterized protein (DUF2267 family)